MTTLNKQIFRFRQSVAQRKQESIGSDKVPSFNKFMAINEDSDGLRSPEPEINEESFNYQLDNESFGL